MVRNNNSRLSRRKRIAGDDDMRFIRNGEDALDARPDGLGDQGGSIVSGGGSEEGERQQEREQGVGDAQAQQPRQQMQGGAEQKAEAVKMRCDEQEWHHGGRGVSHGGGRAVWMPDGGLFGSQGMMINGVIVLACFALLCTAFFWVGEW